MEQLRETLGALARRAGFTEAHPTVLAVVACSCLALVGWGAFRWLAPIPGSAESFSIESPAQTQDASATGACELDSNEDGGEPADGTLYVHVTGAVMHSGVVTLPPDARVADAISAAGGILASAAPDALNLARRIADGEQIVVPTLDEVASASAAGAVASADAGSVDRAFPGPASSPTESTVNINAASVEELDALPGVGPATAQRIIDDRESNGPFATPEDLMRVRGIGPKKFEEMRDAIVVR